MRYTGNGKTVTVKPPKPLVAQVITSDTLHWMCSSQEGTINLKCWYITSSPSVFVSQAEKGWGVTDHWQREWRRRGSIHVHCQIRDRPGLSIQSPHCVRYTRMQSNAEQGLPWNAHIHSHNIISLFFCCCFFFSCRPSLAVCCKYLKFFLTHDWFSTLCLQMETLHVYC